MKPFIRVLAILVLLAPPVTASAQGGAGIKAGLSFETASTRGVDPGATSRSGFAVGVGLASQGVIGLGVEAMYAQRGFSSSTAGNSRRLDYVDVPVTLRVGLPIPAIAPYAYAGPQGSFELQCGSGGGACPSGRPKVTYAGVIGAGVRLSGIMIEGRYVYGLTDLKLSTVQSSESYKSRSLLLLVGLGM